MIPLISSKDPRSQPLAYISDGVNLAEVIELKGPNLILEDCRTGKRHQVSLQKVRAGWELVKAAPSGEIDVAA